MNILKSTTRSLMAAGLVTALATPALAKDVRIASHVSSTSPLYANAEMFAARIGKKIPSLTFKFYPGGQLGKEKALIDNVRLGSLEMAIVASGVLKLDPKLGIFDLPWLFPNRASAERALGGEFGNEVKKEIETKQGFIVLGIYENGFRHVVNTKRAINTPADMKGLKIRVTGSVYKRDGFTAMGADPVPVAWKETFTAIQQGVVDGAEAALYGIYGAKLYEITKYLSLTSHTWSPSFLIASKSFWNSLTADQKKAMHEVADGMTKDAFDQAAKLEQGYLEKMKGKIVVNKVDPAPFQTQAKVVYDKYTKAYGDKWIKLIRAAETK